MNVQSAWRDVARGASPQRLATRSHPPGRCAYSRAPRGCAEVETRSGCSYRRDRLRDPGDVRAVVRRATCPFHTEMDSVPYRAGTKFDVIASDRAQLHPCGRCLHFAEYPCSADRSFTSHAQTIYAEIFNSGQASALAVLRPGSQSVGRPTSDGEPSSSRP